ncbi:hypothetical protein QQ045_033294 [Rhodiola kirilowii]
MLGVDSMEVTVIRRISDLEVSMSNWGALYIAFLATFISIIVTRIRYMIQTRRLSSKEICIGDFDDDLDDADFEDDDDDVSVSSFEDEESETETRESDEEVKSKLQRGFSWSDFAMGKSVVKLWDGIGLSLDSLNQPLISLYDLEREQRITSVINKCELPSSIARPISASRRCCTASPSIVAEWNEKWDPSGDGVKITDMGDK